MHPYLLALLIQPLLAGMIILLIRRVNTLAHLVPALVKSGLVGAILSAIYTFSSSTVPIAPYELHPGAWRPILLQSLASLYAGFGLGVILAALVAVPWTLLKNRGK